MNKIIGVLAVILAAWCNTALGQMVVTDPVVEESPFYGKLDLQYQRARNADEQSLFGKIFYLEYKVGTVAVTAGGYHDQGFKAAYVGLAKQVADELQLGLSIGKAKYDGEHHTVWNPWAYYESEEYKMLLYAEWYPKDKVEPWYYKGYIEKGFGKTWFAGLYGENLIGLGPMAGFYLNEKFRFWVTVPIAFRPGEERKRWMAGVSWTF